MVARTYVPIGAGEGQARSGSTGTDRRRTLSRAVTFWRVGHTALLPRPSIGPPVARPSGPAPGVPPVQVASVMSSRCGPRGKCSQVWGPHPGPGSDWMDWLTPPDWAKDGLCREHPEVSFFPPRGAHRARQGHLSPLPRPSGVLEYALADDSLVGVWAGRRPRAAAAVDRKAAKVRRPPARLGVARSQNGPKSGAREPVFPSSPSSPYYNRSPGQRRESVTG